MRATTLFVPMLALAALSGAARGGILYVDARADDSGGGRSWAGAHRTVQAAIDAAGPSDEVWVAAGVYRERIVFPVKHGPVVFGGFLGTEGQRAQRDPARNETVLDAEHRGSVVVARAMLGALDGFTLRNGTGTPVSARDVFDASPAPEVLCGGGAYVTGRITLRHCIIEDCSAEFGGGVAFHGGNGPSLESCTLRNNRAERGGGLAVFGTASGYSVASAARGCRFEGNRATLGGGAYVARYVLDMEGCTLERNRAERGAGLLVDNANASVSGNVFRGNAADVGGGASLEQMSGGSLSSNVFSGNTSKVEGGGVAVRDQAKTALRNNTLTRNTAKRGGALCITSPAGPLVLNNILARNSSGALFAPVVPWKGYTVAAPSVRHNLFFQNRRSDEEGLGDAIGQAGNRAADPLLEADGIHLRMGSPCVDAGDGEGRPHTDRDIDGQGRQQGIAVDIGADERGLGPVLRGLK